MHTPHPFDLDLTVRSHGFYDLPPWTYDRARRVVSRPLQVRSGRVVVAEVAPVADRGELAFRMIAQGRPSARDAKDALAAMRTCLALDEDLDPFYRRIEELDSAAAAATSRRSKLPALRWAAVAGAGRLLRSPTVFEDALKTLCTTNCTWALTRTMVRNLVDRLGTPGPDGRRTFPDAQALAARPEAFFRDVVRAGYRAGAMRTIAREVASGAIDMEGWRASPLSTDALAAAIRALPGFGPYATEHLLRLLGRFDHLALDSWTRAKLARLRGARRAPSDRAIARWYAPYGRYAGLAMWLEVTADWHDTATPTWP